MAKMAVSDKQTLLFMMYWKCGRSSNSMVVGNNSLSATGSGLWSFGNGNVLLSNKKHRKTVKLTPQINKKRVTIL
jgi:hypothetical protein